MKRPLGALVSPHDYRDYTLAKIGLPVLASLPKEFPGGSTVEEWSKYIPPNAPYDQDIYGMCVAFGLVAIKSIQEHRERDAWEDYSPGYIYGWREPNQYKGEGMYPREALANLVKKGVPPRREFPMLGYYNTLSKLIEPQKDILLRMALPQKVQSYVAVRTVEEVKTALTKIGPVGISIPVYESFFEGGHLNKPNTSKEKFYGNHFMAIIGWIDNRWIVLNSWGKNWGSLNGFCTLPFDYPKNEMWAITDLKPVDPVIRMTIGSKTYTIGDKTFEMDTAPFIKDDRTFVPIRFVAQALGCAVDWKETGPGQGQVIITKGG